MTGVLALAAGWFGRSIAWSAPRNGDADGARAGRGRAPRAGSVSDPDASGGADASAPPRLITTINGEATTAVLARLVAGDTNALGALYQTFYEPLWRFAIVLLQSPDLAEEVIQDVFLRLAARRETLDIQTDIRVYLYTAVRNRVRDLVRHERTTTAVESRVQEEMLDAPAVGTAPVSPDVLVEGAEFMHAYQHALSILTTRERQALQLRWDQELTLSQVASALGISIEGARLAVARAQQKIQVALERYRE